MCSLAWFDSSWAWAPPASKAGGEEEDIICVITSIHSNHCQLTSHPTVGRQSYAICYLVVIMI